MNLAQPKCSVYKVHSYTSHILGFALPACSLTRSEQLPVCFIYLLYHTLYHIFQYLLCHISTVPFPGLGMFRCTNSCLCVTISHTNHTVTQCTGLQPGAVGKATQPAPVEGVCVEAVCKEQSTIRTQWWKSLTTHFSEYIPIQMENSELYSFLLYLSTRLHFLMQSATLLSSPVGLYSSQSIT